MRCLKQPGSLLWWVKFNESQSWLWLCVSVYLSCLQSCSGAGGSTDLWRPLRSLSLLPPCQGMRNVLLLSDGHVQNQPVTLQLVRENSCHTRLFTCGLRSAFKQVSLCFSSSDSEFLKLEFACVCLCLAWPLIVICSELWLRQVEEHMSFLTQRWNTLGQKRWFMLLFLLTLSLHCFWGWSWTDLLVVSGARSGSAYGVSRLQISGGEVAAV